MDLRTAMVLAALLNATGAALRWAGATLPATPSYELVLVGQFLASCCQCFVFACPAKLSSVWFGVEERNTASAIGWMGTYAGISIGFLVPPLIVSDAGSSATTMPQLLLLYAVAGCAVLSLLLVGFRARPPSPPSAISLRCERNSGDSGGSGGSVSGGGGGGGSGRMPKLHCHASDILADSGRQLAAVRLLLRDRRFACVAASFGISTGVTYAVGTVIEQLWSYTLTPGAIAQLGFLQVRWCGAAAVATTAICNTTSQRCCGCASATRL